jgi:hypothetical protein
MHKYSDPGSGIKHPGSATLVGIFTYEIVLLDILLKRPETKI